MVASKKRQVNWTIVAARSLELYYQRIKTASPYNANKVKKEILKAAKGLATHPRKYQIDEYYPKESGEVRRFIKWHYRVVYEVREDRVTVLNVIHTSQEPFTG